MSFTATGSSRLRASRDRHQATESSSTRDRGAEMGFLANRFTYSFEPWVVESWKEHCKELGAAEIAEAFRRNLSDPEGALKAAGYKRKPTQIFTGK